MDKGGKKAGKGVPRPHTGLPLHVHIYICRVLDCNGWHGGATSRVLDLRSTGDGFKSYSGQSCITTLGKLFTPTCLCHKAV